MDDEEPGRPLSREEFRQLQRGDRLRDRGGREWIVRGPAYLDAELGSWCPTYRESRRTYCLDGAIRTALT